MPKKVKTRKQKILSDSRRKYQASTPTEANFPTYSLPKSSQLTPAPAVRPSAPLTAPQVSTVGYQHLSTDLRKTLLLTFSIIVAQLLISYLMR
jgi:hypothetical protein